MFAAICHVSRHFKTYAILAYCLAASERIGEAFLTQPYTEMRANQITQYFVNYPEHGVAKRALIGTVLTPVMGLFASPEVFVFWLMVALNVAAFAAILYMTERFLPDAGEGTADSIALLRCALAVGGLGVMQVAHDLGRFDLLNLAVLIFAIAMVARGKIRVATLLSGAGVLIHEAFTVYAAPLIIAFGWQSLRKELMPGQTAIRLAPLGVIIAGVSAAVLFYGNSEAAVAVPHGTGGYVWARGLVEVSGNLALWEVMVLGLYWLALAAVICGVYVVARRAPDLLLVASASPLALNLLGIDHARWLTLGFYLVAINIAVQVRFLDLPLRSLPTWARASGVLLCLPVGPMGVVRPFAWIPF